MNWIIDWYQDLDLPRWLKFGINSLIATLGYRLGVFLILPMAKNLIWMTLGVTNVFYAYFTPNLPFILRDIFSLGFWFIFGAILGRFIKNSGLAVLIWVIAQIIGWLSIFLFVDIPSY